MPSYDVDYFLKKFEAMIAHLQQWLDKDTFKL